jgi:hypothetical protein
MLCKIISYNLTIVINSIYKLGITPAFFNTVELKEPMPLMESKKIID